MTTRPARSTGRVAPSCGLRATRCATMRRLIRRLMGRPMLPGFRVCRARGCVPLERSGDALCVLRTSTATPTTTRPLLAGPCRRCRDAGRSCGGDEPVTDFEGPILPPDDYVPPPDFNLTLEKWAEPLQVLRWWRELVVRFHHSRREYRRRALLGPDHGRATICRPTIRARDELWPTPPWSCGPTGPTACRVYPQPRAAVPGRRRDAARDGQAAQGVGRLLPPRQHGEHRMAALVRGRQSERRFRCGRCQHRCAPGCVAAGWWNRPRAQEDLRRRHCFDAGLSIGPATMS